MKWQGIACMALVIAVAVAEARMMQVRRKKSASSSDSDEFRKRSAGSSSSDSDSEEFRKRGASDSSSESSEEMRKKRAGAGSWPQGDGSGCCEAKQKSIDGHSGCKSPIAGTSFIDQYAAGTSMQSLALNGHNKCRANTKHKPTRPLKPLRWSDSLACVATKWAAQCVTEHDSYAERKFEDGQKMVGQNLAFYWGNEANMTALALRMQKGWCDEEVNWEPGQGLNCDKADEHCQIGHFTQMVWKRTKEVGCGMVKCPDGMVSLACNYGPAGNVKSRRNPKKDPFKVKG